MNGDWRRRQPQRVRAVERHRVVDRLGDLAGSLFLDGNAPARAGSRFRRVLRSRYCRSQRSQRRGGGQQPRDPWIHGQALLVRPLLAPAGRQLGGRHRLRESFRSTGSVAATPTYSSIGCAVPKDQLRGGRTSACVRQTGLFRAEPGANSSRTVATHPRRSLRFSSESDPPCASAICRQSTSPMPDPCGLVVKNGTNRFALLARSRPFVLHHERERPVLARPPNAHAAVRLERRVDGVAHEVDQQLIELVAVGVHRRPRTRRRRRPACASRAPPRDAPTSPTSSGTLFGAGSRASRAYADMNRTSASDRPPITVKPAAQIVVGVGGARSADRAATADFR